MTKPTNAPTLREVLAQNLRQLRQLQALSQEKLAELAGFHRTYVSQVERCRTNVSVDNLARLAEPLGVAAYRLLMPAG